ncbi:HNH endonuclease, partial [Glycomyces paridis]
MPLLEGKPISVAQARLLACEAGIIPSVFDYTTGEAVELGRALRLPNTALRRKLELEQPGGCAWTGCSRPLAWTEAHHITHWADGGATVAENLSLLCRFHHGRIHTAGWSLTKTGPGKALIVHHDHDTTADTGADADAGAVGCGCADWRTDADLDAVHTEAGEDLLPLGLYRSEWSEALKSELRGWADMADRARSIKAMNDAKARARARFSIKDHAEDSQAEATPVPISTSASEPNSQSKAASGGEPGSVDLIGSRQARTRIVSTDHGEPPFLPCPLRWRPGRGAEAPQVPPARTPERESGPSPCPQPRSPTAP